MAIGKERVDNKELVYCSKCKGKFEDITKPCPECGYAGNDTGIMVLTNKDGTRGRFVGAVPF